MESGFTTGPSTSTGAISSLLNYDPRDLPIADFMLIQGKVVDLDNRV
jgi:hypothetical protein